MKTKRPLTFPSRVIDIWQCAKSREHAYPRPRWPLLFFFAALSVRHHDGALLGQRGGRLGQRQKIRGVGQLRWKGQRCPQGGNNGRHGRRPFQGHGGAITARGHQALVHHHSRPRPPLHLCRCRGVGCLTKQQQQQRQQQQLPEATHSLIGVGCLRAIVYLARFVVRFICTSGDYFLEFSLCGEGGRGEGKG